ncbi:Uma2 family endonuclease [Deferribacter autotrophicus]|uniref:Uma2 family endonuclease n=1 Tax=Deferribacter autotrophicus TaxID=500465 RepID=A0A5A8F6L7_9BACT|nr:Uma2 family endonuclease [Deferribacter autotrophicus]KAA0257364.1 Uma2 family endonuclease [Deferribacter autotrophicus]
MISQSTKELDNHKYAYQDYLTWSDDKRWKIIDGVPYNMSPASPIKHQIISEKIYGTVYEQRKKLKGCNLFNTLTDIVFDYFNVVQPDIFIVCDKNKITEKNIEGSPNLIIGMKLLEIFKKESHNDTE